MRDRLKVRETLIMRVHHPLIFFCHVCELEDDAMSRFCDYWTADAPPALILVIAGVLFL
jgi:hypothetical protein